MMKSLHISVSAVLICLSSFAAAADAPSAAAVEQPASEPFHAYFTQGIFGGDEFFESRSDLLLPVLWWGNTNGAVLLNGRAVFTDGGEQELNAGLVIRQRLFPESALAPILGASIFYDSRWTEDDTHFSQLGLGVELLTEWFDARYNLYLPENKRELLHTETHTATSTSTRSGDYELYGTAHQIRESWKETTTRTTVTDIFSLYEVPLKGWDAEAGVKLPIPSDWFEARAFIGCYDFTGKGMHTDRISGLKGRLELRAWDKLYLGAELYEDDELYGTDYMFSASLRIPLGRGAVRSFRETGTSGRMLEMVMRDPHINTGAALEHEQNTEVNQSSKRIDNLVMDYVVFVDNERGDDDNPGTSEAPKESIQGGVNRVVQDNAAYRNVLVHGTATPYGKVWVSELTELNLIGAGTVMGTRGKALGTMPVVARSAGDADTLFALNNIAAVSVRGFEFRGLWGVAGDTSAADTGISMTYNGATDIEGNIFRNLNHGIAISSSSSTHAGRDIRIVGNTFVGNGIATEISLAAVGNVNISGNTFTGLKGQSVGGIGLNLRGAAKSVDILANIVRDMASGILVTMESGSSVSGGLDISGNDVRDTSGHGIYAEVQKGGTVNGGMNILGNDVSGVGKNGIYAYVNGGTVNGGVSISGNRVSGAVGNGIFLGLNSGSLGGSDAVVSGNTITGVGNSDYAYGININAGITDIGDIILTGNKLSDIDGTLSSRGVFIIGGNVQNMDWTITGNTFRNFSCGNEDERYGVYFYYRPASANGVPGPGPSAMADAIVNANDFDSTTPTSVRMP